MTLEVRVSNAAAIAMYRRFGFAPSGVRPDYYADDGEDALIMWAHDVDEPAFDIVAGGGLGPKPGRRRNKLRMRFRSAT
jgi:hypothetical protein